jgi:hypothetical protein
MRFASSSSWTVRWGTEHAVDLALYVRDALALSVETDPELPQLEPSVPVSVPAGVDRDVVRQQWPDWWAEVLAYPRSEPPEDLEELLAVYPGNEGSPSLIGRPELRTAVQALSRPAAEYAAARVPHTAPRFSGVGGIVRELEAERGRKARPFRLTITEVGVAGVLWHRLTADHMLISARFRDDESACRAALHTLFAELA